MDNKNIALTQAQFDYIVNCVMDAMDNIYDSACLQLDINHIVPDTEKIKKYKALVTQYQFLQSIMLSLYNKTESEI